MKFRSIVASAVTAGALGVGTLGMGVAVAETPAPPQHAPSHDAVCHRAKAVMDHLKQLDQRIRVWYHKLGELRAKADAAGRDDLVARIDQAMTRLREGHDRIAAKIKEISDKVGDKCGPHDETLEPLA